MCQAREKCRANKTKRGGGGVDIYIYLYIYNIRCRAFFLVTAILYLTAMALHYRIAAALCLRPPPHSHDYADDMYNRFLLINIVIKLYILYSLYIYILLNNK